MLFGAVWASLFTPLPLVLTHAVCRLCLSHALLQMRMLLSLQSGFVLIWLRLYCSTELHVASTFTTQLCAVLSLTTPPLFIRQTKKGVFPSIRTCYWHFCCFGLHFRLLLFELPASNADGFSTRMRVCLSVRTPRPHQSEPDPGFWYMWIAPKQKAMTLTSALLVVTRSY